MARMIEALKQAEARRARPTDTPAVPAPDPCPSANGGEILPDMPYIEVGGKGKPMSASPEVLAAAPARPAPPQLLPVPPAAGPAPLAVSFRPWSGSRPGSCRLAAELLTFHQPDHPVSKQYQTLLGNLLGDGKDAPCRVLLFTAASAGAGTTTVLLNLAVAACDRDRRQVAALDLNLRRPALATRLGLPAVPGLREVLAGTAAPDHALQATAVPGLYALAAAADDGPSPALTAEALRWLVCWLRERFDAVFVDGPPWEEAPEPAALAGHADGVYPVLGEAEAQGPAVGRLLQAITRRGGRLRGVLHTQRAG
jgi:Mrp family chromosome partitioning ATPase